MPVHAVGLPQPVRPDRVLVRPHPGTLPSEVEALHAANGALSHRDYPDIDGWQVVTLRPGRDAAASLAAYQRSPLIAEAEPDHVVHTTVSPNDPDYANGNLWHLHNTGQGGGLAGADINAPEAWDVLNSAGDLVVAVVDSGIRRTHQDLAANLWVNPGEIPGNRIDDDRNGFVDDVNGIDAAANNGIPEDVVGHGTHVAGTIGAVGNNGVGVTGVAWRVKIMACRFLDAAGNGATSDAIQCIDYARQKGARVINASWGGYQSSSFLRSAIDKARQAGIVFVAAAGNDAANVDNQPFYPAAYDLDNIVSVAATTRTDALADFSNQGARSVDLAAPGAPIYSTWNSADNAYTWLSGTSMAAPQVSGAVALLRARYPADTYRQTISRLLAATDPLPALAGRCVTGGRLNLQRALGTSLVADFSASPPSGSAPLTVSFVDLSQGAIASRTWNFGDGSPAETGANPSHTFTREGNFTVTLQVTSNTGTTATKSRTVSVVANYQIEAATYAWVDPAGMTALPLTDDGVSGAQALPFAFSFYGQSYSQVFVGANGLVGFVNQGLGTAANTDLPNSGVPNAAVYPYWDDLSPASGGSVRFGVAGTAPNRQVVISWVGVPTRAKPSATLTFQVLLQEQGNRVVFQYQSVNASRPTGGGRGATIGLENEGGQVAARYSFNGSAALANSQAIRFVPASLGGLAVTPSADGAASGLVGGPFAPASQTYSVRNSGTAPVTWRVTNTQPWLVLSRTGGTLDPGVSADVMVSVSASAGSLPAGTYLDTVTFQNTGNGLGNTTRTFRLAVNGTTPEMSVTPAAGFTPSGIEGGPFAPVSQVYTLINSGDATLDWQASVSAGWTVLSRSGGSLAPGDSTTVAVSLAADAESLPPGVHTDTVRLVNLSNGRGNTTRPVTLTIGASPGVLAVTPGEGFSASGPVGGPFTPGSRSFTLANTGGSPLDWSASTDGDWLVLDDTGGSLAPGATVQVLASLGPAAESLPAGAYSDTVRFVNQSNGTGDAARVVALTVTDGTVAQAPTLLPGTVAGGFFNLIVRGEPNTRYTVEQAIQWDVWTPVTTVLTGPDGTANFADASVQLEAWRYYRARLAP